MVSALARPRVRVGYISHVAPSLLLGGLVLSSPRLDLILAVVKTFVDLLDGHSSAVLTILLLVVCSLGGLH